jgi:excisionase family DNA binding protein
MPVDSSYLTNDEAAEYLRISPRTLEKLRGLGAGPAYRRHGRRRVAYAIKDLDDWSEQHFHKTYELG